MEEEIVSDTNKLRVATIGDVRQGAKEAKMARPGASRANAEDSLVARVIRAVKQGFNARSIRGQMRGGETDASQTASDTSEG